MIKFMSSSSRASVFTILVWLLFTLLFVSNNIHYAQSETINCNDTDVCSADGDVSCVDTDTECIINCAHCHRSTGVKSVSCGTPSDGRCTINCLTTLGCGGNLDIFADNATHLTVDCGGVITISSQTDDAQCADAVIDCPTGADTSCVVRCRSDHSCNGTAINAMDTHFLCMDNDSEKCGRMKNVHTQTPTRSPSLYPSLYPSIYPSSAPTGQPTQSTTDDNGSGHQKKAFGFALLTKNTNGDVKTFIAIIAGVIAVVFICLLIACICVCVYLRKNSTAFHRMFTSMRVSMDVDDATEAGDANEGVRNANAPPRQNLASFSSSVEVGSVGSGDGIEVPNTTTIPGVIPATAAAFTVPPENTARTQSQSQSQSRPQQALRVSQHNNANANKNARMQSKHKTQTQTPVQTQTQTQTQARTQNMINAQTMNNNLNASSMSMMIQMQGIAISPMMNNMNNNNNNMMTNHRGIMSPNNRYIHANPNVVAIQQPMPMPVPVPVPMPIHGRPSRPSQYQSPRNQSLRENDEHNYDDAETEFTETVFTETVADTEIETETETATMISALSSVSKHRRISHMNESEVHHKNSKTVPHIADDGQSLMSFGGYINNKSNRSVNKNKNKKKKKKKKDKNSAALLLQRSAALVLDEDGINLEDEKTEVDSDGGASSASDFTAVVPSVASTMQTRIETQTETNLTTVFSGSSSSNSGESTNAAESDDDESTESESAESVESETESEEESAESESETEDSQSSESQSDSKKTQF